MSKNLKIHRDKKQLISRFLKGKAPDFLIDHTRLLDNYFCESYETSTIGSEMEITDNPFAIMALGGYGREEQCIHSDVDLLVLFRKRVPETAEKLIEEMIYPLWDIGLDIGHAVRSIKDCMALAREDVAVLISLLDARFITGISLLYSSLADQLQEKILSSQANSVMDWIYEDNHKRHDRYGDSAYLLEPNLKEGQGGLRDYHAMRWVARVRSNLREFEDFEYQGYLSHNELQQFKEALNFIWYVRNHLHHMAGRECDQLFFEHQVKLAKVLKYKREKGQEPVERFLEQLHSNMEYVKQQYLMFFYELGYVKPLNIAKASRKRTRVSGLIIEKGGMLNFTGPEIILDEPHLLMKIFEESARLKMPLSAEAKRLVKEFDYLVDENYRIAPSTIRSFERILISPAPTFNVLNEMLNTGLLIKIIPEMRAIQDRIQYDQYHLYPVDKHSLRVVETINAFDTPEHMQDRSLYSQLYKDLKSPKLLLWAALLHDIGKGNSKGNHDIKGAEIARSILADRGLSKDQIETVSFLVKEHLLLTKTATRRDINDEEISISCARSIKDPERLKMLYLLSVADAKSTGPKAWNDWTATLLEAFFLKILNILEKGELASEESLQAVEEKKKRVLGAAVSKKETKHFEALIDVMSPRYLLYVPAKDMLNHIKLYDHLKDQNFVWDIFRPDISNTRTITICAKDQPGLFSKLAGVFTLNSINILHAQIFTWRNNIALDVFEVTPPPDRIFEEERWQRAKENLESVLSGELDLGEALKQKMTHHRTDDGPTRTRSPEVIVDNESSSFFTIIDVFTYDFPGLLFNITDTLFRCQLDIWIAKIATKVDQVVDVFYVRDYDGQKVDSPDKLAVIKSAIEEVITLS